MDIAREDILVGGLVLAMAAAVGYPHISDMFTEPSDIVKQCRSEAKAAETNSSLTQWNPTCTCIPPDKVDERRFTVSDKVDEATTIYLIRCKLPEDAPLDSPFVIPVRRITNHSAIDNTSALNTSRTRILNGTE